MSNKYLDSKKFNINKSSNLNVNDLLAKAKIEKKKENRKNIIIAASAISALAISGIIISL